MDFQVAITRPLAILLNEVLFARRCFAAFGALVLQSAVCICFGTPLFCISAFSANTTAPNLNLSSATGSDSVNAVDDYRGNTILWHLILLFISTVPLQVALMITLTFSFTAEQCTVFPTLGVRLLELVVNRRWLLLLSFSCFQYFYGPLLARRLFGSALTSLDHLSTLYFLGTLSYTVVFFVSLYCFGQRSIRFNVDASRRSLFARICSAAKQCVLRAPMRVMWLGGLTVITYAVMTPIFSMRRELEDDYSEYQQLKKSEPSSGFSTGNTYTQRGNQTLLAQTGDALLSCVILLVSLLFFDLSFELTRVVYQTVLSHYLRIEERIVDTTHKPLKLQLSSAINVAGFTTRLPWSIQAICIDQPELFKYLGALDLRVLSDSSELRRAVIFGRLSYDSSARLVEDALAGDDPRVAWNTLLAECMSQWRALTQSVNCFNDRHITLAKVFGDLEYPYYMLVQPERPIVTTDAQVESRVFEPDRRRSRNNFEPIGSPQRISLSERSSATKIAESSSSPTRATLQVFAAAWKSNILNAATTCVLSAPFVNTRPPLAAHAILTQRHAVLHCWMIESVLNLAVASYDEDTYGVVQCQLGMLLNSLFELHTALTMNLQLTGPYRAESSRSSLARMAIDTLFLASDSQLLPSLSALALSDSRLVLRETIECSLRNFASKFDHHLVDIQSLNPEYALELQRSAHAFRRVDTNHNQLQTSSHPTSTWTNRRECNVIED